MSRPPRSIVAFSSTIRVASITGGAPSRRFGLFAPAASAAAYVGCARNSASLGNAELPAVWSPWSEQITTWVIG